MKLLRNGFVLALSFLSLSVWLQAAPSRVILRGDQGISYRYRVQTQARNRAEMAQSMNWLREQGFDVSGMQWSKREIEVITNDAGLKKLEAARVSGRIVDRRTPGRRGGELDLDPRYLNPQKVEQKLKALQAQNPQVTRLEQIGTSIQGRPIWALLISSTPNVRTASYFEKPSLILDGMHHAREVMTSEIVMDAAETLLTSLRQRNPRARAIVEGWNIWVVPMLNVDGNNIVWTQNSWWRKNARGESASVWGVDLNRNYPFKWSQCNGSSGSPNSDTYRGQSAGSEPETQALVKLAQLVQPTGSLSYHSFSELVLYPYGCRGVLTGENALFAKVATELAQMLPQDSGNGHYTPGTPWQLLYSVDGDSMAFQFSQFGTLALTFEVNESFQPNYEVREPTLIKHRKAWAYFLQRMSQNLMTLTVVDGRTGKPAQAQLSISKIIHSQGEPPFRTNPAGHYFKVLDPGHYDIVVKLADGRSAQMGVDMKGEPQKVSITVP